MLVSYPEIRRCIAGRWGSVASTEEKLLGANGCVATVLFNKLWALSRKLRMILEPLAEDRMRNVLQAQVAYRMARGRWAREVLAAQAYYLMMNGVELQHTAVAPLQHFLRAMQTSRNEDERAAEGDYLCVLVTGGADRIVREFNDLVSTMMR